MSDDNKSHIIFRKILTTSLNKIRNSGTVLPGIARASPAKLKIFSQSNFQFRPELQNKIYHIIATNGSTEPPLVVFRIISTQKYFTSAIIPVSFTITALPYFPEAGNIAGSITDCMINIPVTQIILNKSRIKSLVSQSIPARMAQHMWMQMHR